MSLEKVKKTLLVGTFIAGLTWLTAYVLQSNMSQEERFERTRTNDFYGDLQDIGFESYVSLALALISAEVYSGRKRSRKEPTPSNSELERIFE